MTQNVQNTQVVEEPAKKVVVSGVTANVKRKSTLSIKNHKLNKQEEVDEKKKEAATGEARNEFSESMLRSKWIQMAREFKKISGNLFLSLTKEQPELEGNFIVNFRFDSEAQLLMFDEYKSEMLTFLRKELQNYAIQLNFIMNEVKNVERKETSKERYNKMIEKYPALDTLRKRFNMDLEYD